MSIKKDEEILICFDCKNEIKETDEKYQHQNEYICEKCRENYFNCEGCAELVNNDDSYFCDECESSFCNECFNSYNPDCGNDNLVFCSESCQEHHYNNCDDCQDNNSNEEENESYSQREVNINTKIYQSKTEGKTIKSLRKFGVEIECYYPNIDTQDDVFDKLPSDVGVSEDGSLGDKGVEFQTPPASGDKGENLIKQICDILNSAGHSITKSCGLHIHLDGADIQNDYAALIKLWSFYYVFDDVLLAMLPKSRRTNRFCMPLKKNYLLDKIFKAYTTGAIDDLWYKMENYGGSDEEKENELVERKSKKWDDTRYSGINLHSLLALGHLEIRYHSGTINDKKILEWTNLHARIMDLARKCADKDINGTDKLLSRENLQKCYDKLVLTDKINDFFSILQLPASSENYFRARIKLFNPSIAEENDLTAKDETLSENDNQQ